MNEDVRDVWTAEDVTEQFIKRFLNLHPASAIAKDLIAALSQAGLTIEQGWSSDMEAAPRDGTFILIHSHGKTPVVAYFSQAAGLFPNLGWQSVPGDKRYKPTHWKPLTPPKE